MIAPRVAISREHTGNRQTQAIQSNSAKIVKAVNSIRPGMVTVYGVIFKVGSNTYVPHGLGRVPVGYAWVNYRVDPAQGAPSGSFGCQRNTTADPNNDETKTLSLGPYQPGIADIEVW